MTDIVQEGNPVLRGVAAPVSHADIGSPALAAILSRMQEALAREPDGVAIAAPQIGIPLRMFIVAGFILRKKESDEIPSDKIFINPEIVSLSKEKAWLEEGCLSVRRFYGEVQRAHKAKVRAWDERGRQFTMGASGLLAQVFQHETDHLDGTLFIDVARNLRELTPEEQEAIFREAAEARTT